MRKLSLLAAAAMVAGGSAFAMDGGGVSISGEANFGVKFKEDRAPGSEADLQFHHEFDIKFAASGTTDGGVSFGAKMTLDNQESTDIAVSGGVVTPGSDGTAAVQAAEGTYYFTIGDTGKRVLDDNDELFKFAKEGDKPKDTATPSSSDYQAAVEAGEHDGAVSGLVFVASTDVTADGNTPAARFVVTTTTNNEGIQTITRANVNITGWRRVTEASGNLEVGDIIRTADATVAVENRELITAFEAYEAAYNLGEGAAIGGEEGAEDSINSKVVIASEIVESSDGTPATAPTITPVKASGGKVGNHAEVYISMDMHTLTIGSDIDAADKIAGGLTDPGFDGIGIDDQAEAVWGGTAADVRYDGDFGVAKVAISYGDNNDDAEWAAGFSFDVEPVTMGAGFDSHGVVSLGMGFSQGQIAMNALYSTDSDAHEADNEKDMAGGTYKWTKGTGDDATTHMVSLEKVTANAPDVKNQAMGVDVTYKMNDTTSLVLVAAQHTIEGAKWAPKETDNDKLTDGESGVEGAWRVSDTKVDAFGVGFSHDLGGGATLKAGAGSVDSDAVADLGITMTF